MRKITFLGDSVTFGQHVDQSVRWTTIISERLGCGWSCRNEGVNGETTRLALERFPKAVQVDPPDILTIQYGMNDCNCWDTDKGVPRVSALAFIANLHEMVVRARRCGTRQVVLINGYPSLRLQTMANWQRYEDANLHYGMLVRDVAEQTRTELCDMHTEFHSHSRMDDSDESSLYQLLLRDGLHLSERGHIVYADIVFRVIEQCARRLEKRD